MTSQNNSTGRVQSYLPALLLVTFIGQQGLLQPGAQAQAIATLPASDSASTTASAPDPATAHALQTGQAKRDPAQQDQVSSTKMKTVTVPGKRADEQIDRSVYDVKLEVITSSASVADVLANVPSVSVDLDGKVAIRGNQNVQVFVDGKPSAMFSGPNAGNALNSYPATALERVEVITTPGAQFGSDGGGGPILNLITRRERATATQGLISINEGPQGRDGVSLNGSYASGRVQLEGFGSLVRNVFERHGSSDIDRTMGQSVWKTHRDSASRLLSTSLTLNPTIRYNLGETDRLTAALNFNNSRSAGNSDDDQRTSSGDVTPYEAYQRHTDLRSRYINYQAILGWERKFGNTEEFKVDLRNSGSETNSNNRYRDRYVITAPTDFRPEGIYGNNLLSRLTELSADYTKRINPAVNLKLGAKLGRTTGQTDADFFNIDAQTGEELIDNDRNSGFRSAERSYAAYLSPNMRITEHWTAQPGLRYERIIRHINYLKQDKSANDSNSKMLPSLHIQYGWGERSASVTGAYSRRITRPTPSDLNPNLLFVNEQSYSQGDPRLAPTHNDKYELKYSDTWSTINSNMALFRERDSPLLGRAFFAVPGSVALISEAVNFGTRTNDGISWSLQAKPTREVRLDATVGFRHITQSLLAAQFNNEGAQSPLGTERKITSNNLQLGMQYFGFKDHTIQLNGNYAGTQLNALSETAPNWQAHASWIWRITPTLVLRASLRDVFDSNRIRSTVITGSVRQFNYTELQGRILTLALSQTFGGVSGDAQLRSNAGAIRAVNDQHKP